jgi:hypothetical protein
MRRFILRWKFTIITVLLASALIALEAAHGWHPYGPYGRCW